MTTNPQRLQFRRTVQVAVVLTALVTALVTAGSNSTTLPNGADLTVAITSPVTSTEFEVPPGQPTIDVTVTGTASIGLGEPDATFVYVMDVSGSTDQSSGSCSTILQCEKEFLTQLNDAVIDSGSADEAGLVVFASSAAAADVSPDGGNQLIVAPDAANGGGTFINQVVNSAFSDISGGDGGVTQFSPRAVGQFTNCVAALQAALPSVQASTNGTNVVVFVSDGLCSAGDLGDFDAAIAALEAENAVIHGIATGAGVCGDPNAISLERADNSADGCEHVPNPSDLPDIIPDLIGTTLESLTLSIDGGAPTPIPNSDISLPLPRPGPVSVSYSTTAAGLAPGDHEICVTATGSDVSGGSASVPQCETIHLLQLSATPGTADNDLGAGDNTHTVTATIAGDPAQVDGRLVSFTVGGQNGGETGTCGVNLDCTTDAAGNVSFTYDVPFAIASIGTDTITVTTTIAGNASTVSVQKRWLDLQPPTIACPPSVNPGGNTIPAANKTNQDGFYGLVSADLVDPNPQIFVVDSGTGTIFGPYPSGTNIKYVQAPGATPSATPMTGAVGWLIKGQGDMETFAVDTFGNASDPVSCLVPPKPQ